MSQLQEAYPEEEPRDSESSWEAARLAQHPVEPLQSKLLPAPRGAPHPPGEDVEAPADADDHPRLQPLPVFHHPQLLTRDAEPDEE